ncbi:hypothetical protein [Faecalibacterium prausnitzii]|uniref:hypothetical protein n=1 Tax=Faecalibacterium prausnitzii TaxID=853 RepID=UPI001CBEF196|nr:hypothetical protein [Faecalibacterium prausnitzii]
MEMLTAFAKCGIMQAQQPQRKLFAVLAYHVGLLCTREKGNFMNNLSRISKPNRDIRLAVADEGFYLWQLAAELGITDGTLSKKLRRELSESEKQDCFNAIERMKKSRQHS